MENNNNDRITEETLNIPQAPVTDEGAPAEVQTVEPAQAAPVMAPAPVSTGEQTQNEALLASIQEKMAQLQALEDRLNAKSAEMTKAFESKATVDDQKRHEDKAKAMKRHLDAQPKVQVLVPLSGTEKRGTVLPVTLNGYRFNVPKGVYVAVPQQVGEVIMESMNQTIAAEADNPFNLNGLNAGKADGLVELAG